MYKILKNIKATQITFFIVCFVLLSFSGKTFSQYYKYRHPTIIHVSTGIGPNYAGIGFKTVIGYKNSGLMLGTGILGDFSPEIAVGAQISKKGAYINFGYSIYFWDFPDSYDSYSGAIYGWNISIGKVFYFGGRKEFFIDPGLGYSWGGYLRNKYGENPFNTFMPNIGFGYRFWEKKRWKNEW